MKAHLVAATLLFAIWPFHKKVLPSTQTVFTASMPDDVCYRDGEDNFFFVGPEGTGVGVSTTSCNDAFKDWTNVKMFAPFHTI